MRYIYINKSESPRILTLVSQTNSSASHINLGVGSKIELDYPGLEIYVPHILSRLDESGTDISHLVLRQRESLKESKSKPIEPIKLEETNIDIENAVLIEPQQIKLTELPQSTNSQQIPKNKDENQKVIKSSIFRKKDKSLKA